MATDQSRIRLFENRLLEEFTVLSAKAFIAFWAIGLSLIAWRAWGTASLGFSFVLAVPGLVLWSLTEYALHRFLFHWEPKSAAMRQFVFIMHGNHHLVPNDPLRNLMPPMVSLPLSGLIWVSMLALVGPAGSWLFLGFMVGYVAYDLVHYACHQWPMKGRLTRMLKTNHMRHHHLHDAGNYAITGMMWDRLFRTRITRNART